MPIFLINRQCAKDLIRVVTTLFLLTCLACNSSSRRDGIEIQVSCAECIGKEINIYHHSVFMQNEVKLFQSRFDSSGTMLIKLPNQDTLGLALNVKEGDSTYFHTYLYLQPNTNIQINFKKNDVQFNGDLAAVNTYLADLRKIDIKRQNYRNVWGTDNDRIKSKDSLENYIAIIKSFGADFDKKVASDESLSDYEKDFLTNINTSFETYRRQDFDFYKLLSDRQVYYDNEEDQQIVQYQDSVTNAYFSGLTINPHILKYTGSYYNWHLNIGNRMAELMEIYYKEHQDYSFNYDYLRTTVRSNTKSPAHHDFILSNLIASGYVLDGVAYDALYKLISGFKKDYPRSKYLPELEEILEEYASLKPGAPMKDFTMQDKSGKTFRLSDYKGKLIYVDVWATWCGPCVEEFPYSKKLGERYRKNQDLVFMYVSKDRNEKSWQNYLKKNPDLKGVHGIQPPKEDDYDHLKIDSNNVMLLYKIGGIPRYILIGKDGKIINYNAARPSTLINNKYLDSLLTL
jgi:thiol-disulfide isomerase/thioredoxin